MPEEKDVLWNNFEKHLLNESLTKQRREKLLTMYRMVKRGVRKPYEELTREDIEAFLDDLNRNNFQRIDGRNLSGSTKCDMKRFLKQFFKWYKGNNEFYPKEVAWIKARINKDEMPEEKPVISVEEVHKLANSFNKIELRLLVLLLFDSGFRISEMLSVKKKDITFEEYDEGKKCFWINCNQSKTEKRKIPIPLFTEEIQAFVNSFSFKEMNEDDLVFKVSYPSFLQNLRMKSINVLGRKISPHALRHSSATYYAREFDGNMNILADRYGWTYSSDQLKTYIRRSGAYQKMGAKKVYTNEVLKVKEENAILKEAIQRMAKQMKELALKVEDYNQKKETQLFVHLD